MSKDDKLPFELTRNDLRLLEMIFQDKWHEYYDNREAHIVRVVVAFFDRKGYTVVKKEK